MAGGWAVTGLSECVKERPVPSYILKEDGDPFTLSFTTEHNIVNGCCLFHLSERQGQLTKSFSTAE